MTEIIKDAYLQGGAMLLLVALLVICIVCIFRYVVKPLWQDNKELRAVALTSNDRVARMGEIQRATNENVTAALKENSEILRDLLLASGRAPHL